MYDGVLFLPWNMRMSASVYCQRDPKGNFGLTGLPRQWGHPPGAALELRNWPKAWWLPAVYILPLDRPGSICHAWCWTIQVWGCNWKPCPNSRKSTEIRWSGSALFHCCLHPRFLPATLRFFYRAYAYIKEKWQPKLSPVDGPFQQQSFPTWMSISY